MLLRRIIDHVGAQNWTAIGIDFAIVVIGVFVGLQVTSWNEERIAESRAEVYYQRLIDDLDTELSSRRTRVSYFEQTKAHAVAALQALRSADRTLDVRFLIDAYQATQRWVYAPQRTTYDELMAAGIADAIPDVAIRTRLANLYVSLDASNLTQQEPTPYRDELRRQMPHGVQSAIRESCGDRYKFFDNGLVYLELPDRCVVSLDDDLITEAIAALKAYDELEKDLARHVSILDSKLNSLRVFDAPIREMIEILGAQ